MGATTTCIHSRLERMEAPLPREHWHRYSHLPTAGCKAKGTLSYSRSHFKCLHPGCRARKAIAKVTLGNGRRKKARHPEHQQDGVLSHLGEAEKNPRGIKLTALRFWGQHNHDISLDLQEQMIFIGCMPEATELKWDIAAEEALGFWPPHDDYVWVKYQAALKNGKGLDQAEAEAAAALEEIKEIQ